MLALPFRHIFLFLKGIKCIITLCIRVCIGKLVGFWLISRTNLYGIDDEIWIFSNVSNSFKKKIKEKMNEKYGMCTLHIPSVWISRIIFEKEQKAPTLTLYRSIRKLRLKSLVMYIELWLQIYVIFVCFRISSSTNTRYFNANKPITVPASNVAPAFLPTIWKLSISYENCSGYSKCLRMLDVTVCDISVRTNVMRTWMTIKTCSALQLTQQQYKVVAFSLLWNCSMLMYVECCAFLLFESNEFHTCTRRAVQHSRQVDFMNKIMCEQMRKEFIMITSSRLYHTTNYTCKWWTASVLVRDENKCKYGL